MKPRCSLSLVALSMILGCQDPETSDEPRILDEGVGERIPLDVAQRWMTLEREDPSAGSDDASSFKVTAPRLAAVLSAAPERLGVALHHGLDEHGVHHVLVTTVGQDAAAWGSGVVLDANTDAPVDASTARAWGERYEAANPEAIWYHFFGRDLFDEITSNPGFESIDLEPAVNDLGEPQLLLMVWNEQEGRQARSRDGEPVPYDASNPCPPCGTE